MNASRYTLCILGLLCLLYSCAPKMTSVISGSNYDKKKDATSYVVLPYGSASIPGEWLKGRYNKVSHQQYFLSKADSTTLTVAIGSAESFPFSAPSVKDFEFVKAYYYWESGYQKNQLHQKIELYQSDSVNKFIMWRVHGDTANFVVSTIQLVGSKDCRCKEGAFQSFTITGGKGSDLEKAALLRRIYLGNSN